VEEFVIAAAPDTDLPADPPQVRMADLAEHDWVHYTAPSGLSDILDGACSRAGFRPACRCAPNKGRSALNLARAGLGPGPGPWQHRPPHFDGILLRPDPRYAATVRLHPGPPRPDHRRLRRRDRGRNPCDTSPHHRRLGQPASS